MKKEMILIVGLAHSHTSAIAKLLHDNGGQFGELCHHNTPDLPYDKYEDREILDWVINKKKFINKPFPLKDGMYKVPDAVFFLGSIPSEVKIVFCMRHITDLIQSNMEKCGYSFVRALNKVEYQYDLLLNAPHDIYFCPTDRILGGNKHEMNRLLSFCGLSGNVFDLQPVKRRKRTYVSYRLENTLWRLLHIGRKTM